MPNSKDFTRRAENIIYKCQGNLVMNSHMKYIAEKVADALSLAYQEGRNEAIEECAKLSENQRNVHMTSGMIIAGKIRQLKSN